LPAMQGQTSSSEKSPFLRTSERVKASLGSSLCGSSSHASQPVGMASKGKKPSHPGVRLAPSPLL
jgi:hypothetical protein